MEVVDLPAVGESKPVVAATEPRRLRLVCFQEDKPSPALDTDYEEQNNFKIEGSSLIISLVRQ